MYNVVGRHGFCVTFGLYNIYNIIECIHSRAVRQGLVPVLLKGSTALEVLFNVGGIFAVEALELLVELCVSCVNVVDVGIVIVSSSPSVLTPLLYPVKQNNGSMLQDQSLLYSHISESRLQLYIGERFCYKSRICGLAIEW